MGAQTLASVLDALGRGELSGLAAHFAERATYQEAHAAPISGRAAIAAEFARFAATGVPFRFTVDDVIASAAGACVVYRFATPGGTGEPWRERAQCAIVRIDEGGLIAEWREYEG